MGIFAWIVPGAIAGIVAGRLAGDRWSILATIAAGIVGGLLGGYLAAAMLDHGTARGITLESVLISMAGSLVAIVLWDAYFHGARRSHV